MLIYKILHSFLIKSVYQNHFPSEHNYKEKVRHDGNDLQANVPFLYIGLQVKGDFL